MDYTYVGYTEDRKLVKGKIAASDERVASDMLANAGYRVISLKPAPRFLPDVSKLLKAGVKPEELVTFSRQLALLLESGVNILTGLDILQSQTPDRTLRKVLIEIIHDLRSGKSFSRALAQHPHVFSTLYCKMVAVGEQSGDLETVLRRMADYIERQAAAMAKVRQAMTYPIIVFCLAIAVAIIMVTVLLPPLVDMFTKLGGELPITTRLLIGTIEFIRKYGLYLFIGIVALGVIGFAYIRTPNGRYNRDMLILKLPVIGRLALITELARVCRTLSLLFRAGIPLPEVMALTSRITGNRVVAMALTEVEQDMLRGQGLARPMARRKVFLPLMVEMTRVGEETGSLEQSLTIVSENYEIEADRRIQTLLNMIEPAMTIAMGLFVGFLALSIFMPLYGALKLVG